MNIFNLDNDIIKPKGDINEKLINRLAEVYPALENCKKTGASEDWIEKYEKIIDKILNLLPDGTGFDSGTTIESVAHNKIVFNTAFHHMNSNGYYTRWTYHTVTVTPSFVFPLDIKVSGSNYGNIKDYIAEVFYDCLVLDFDDE